MKLFYCCYGGAHTSVTCASIHLGYLPDDRVPSAAEFAGVPFYDKMDNHKLGTPVFMGRDALGWDIYIIGMKNVKTLVIPAMKSYLNACGMDQSDFLLVNALVELHPITSISGVATRKFGLIYPGRPLTIWGIRKTYPKFLALVKDVKENLQVRGNYIRTATDFS
ncbi:MAG TPA: hypothetical protein DIW17_15470 [Clostridiales bacterium]|mgnify:FL=1|nr:DUF3189 family protein [Clostridia bacterium]HCS75261.1 hypothetical protein [Clostridiales bacterium]